MKLFRGALLGPTILAILITIAGPAWSAPPLMQLGQALGKRYENVRTFVAKVSMQGWSSSMGEMKYDGRAFFMQPNLFRIDYARAGESAPAGDDAADASPETRATMNTLVSNASGLFRWNPEEQTWASTQDSEDQIVALMSHITNLASLSSGEFMNMYTIGNPQDARLLGRVCYVINLQPRQGAGHGLAGAQQTIYFDRRTLLPVRAIVQVPGKRKVTVDFEDIKLNRQLGLDVFGMRG